MRTFHRFHVSFLTITALFAFTLFATVPVAAQEPAFVLAPANAPTWDDTSGYSAVEANRAAGSTLLASPAEASGYDTLEANRMMIARHALESGDLGSLQEEALTEIVAAGMTWGDASGYNAVEANRAAAAG